MTKQQKVFQFKISLEYISPKVWRRIIVPANYSFWDLHVAIQDAMGWDDTHLHEFILPHPETGERVSIGIPNDFDDYGDIEMRAGWEEKISDYLNEGDRFPYIYDFGDNWEHDVLFEKILPREKGARYPQCIAGKRACPPEDCGGVYGYVELLEILGDPKHEEYEEMRMWAGKSYDPEAFDPAKVVFMNPKKRLEGLF